MDTNESSLCRPGGFALTRQMFQFAGIEIPEVGSGRDGVYRPCSAASRHRHRLRNRRHDAMAF